MSNVIFQVLVIVITTLTYPPFERWLERIFCIYDTIVLLWIKIFIGQRIFYTRGPIFGTGYLLQKFPGMLLLLLWGNGVKH